MKKNLWILLAAILVVSLACAPLAALGYVPKADLDKANESVKQLTTDLEKTQTELKSAQSDNKDLQKQLDDSKTLITSAQAEMNKYKDQLEKANGDLEKWSGVQCEQSWDSVMNKVIMIYPLENTAAPDYAKGYLAITQWSTDTKWTFDSNKPYSVLVFDRDFDQTMVMDTVKDCVILNPDFFPFAGK